MENRASYLLVGTFVLALIACGVLFAAWLARFELRDARTYYYIYFRGSVAGLAEGSAVRLRGVPIVNILNIKRLALDWGLPFDPVPLPAIGQNARAYRRMPFP